MNNADMPAMPVIDEGGVLDCDKHKKFAMNPTIATGLTKREEFVCKLFDLIGEHMSNHEDQSTIPSFLYSKGCRFID